MYVDIFIFIDWLLVVVLLEFGYFFKYIFVLVLKGGGIGIYEIVGWLMVVNKEGVCIDDDVR